MKAGKIKTLPVPKGGGYPETDIGKDGVMTLGRWLPGTKQKSYGVMRGAGAATKGKKFLKD